MDIHNLFILHFSNGYMKIKEVRAEVILDSREERTIEVIVNGNAASAPYGKSIGKHEKAAFKSSVEEDVETINKIREGHIPEINEFNDLEHIEKIFRDKIGADTLFVFEMAAMKALAHEKGKQLWQVLSPSLDKNIRDAKFPRLISNTIGGGAHSHGKIKPDFQEFLVTCNKNPMLCEQINKKCHQKAYTLLNNLRLSIPKPNDESAWQTDLDNESVLDIMQQLTKKVSEESSTPVEVGVDIAASQFWNESRKKYFYKNKIASRTREEQIKYIIELAKKYHLFYIEDPLDEEDFEGFKEITKNVNCLIVGDDLTVTNFERVKKAISMDAVTGVIIKPNQTGSLLEVRKIMGYCSRKGIKTIVSHRSGETEDYALADIAFAWQADFIKIPVVGEERHVKVARLVELENILKK